MTNFSTQQPRTPAQHKTSLLGESPTLCPSPRCAWKPTPLSRTFSSARLSGAAVPPPVENVVVPAQKVQVSREHLHMGVARNVLPGSCEVAEEVLAPLKASQSSDN